MNSSHMRRWGIGFAGGAFAVALALLLVLVLRSLAVQITPPPGSVTEPYPDVSSEEKCMAEGGRWITQGGAEDGMRPVPVAVDGKPQPYCQGLLRFERERMQQQEQSQQTSLFVFAIGGGIAVAVGVVMRARPAVAGGLLLGGIASFFIAGIHVWMLSPGWGRLVTIVVVFLALVGIGLYAFREEPGANPSTPPTA
jgi:hypothetical protein